MARQKLQERVIQEVGLLIPEGSIIEVIPSGRGGGRVLLKKPGKRATELGFHNINPDVLIRASMQKLKRLLRQKK